MLYAAAIVAFTAFALYAAMVYGERQASNRRREVRLQNVGR